jgi:Mn2+/Fe2+ NRAMP family transporter
MGLVALAWCVAVGLLYGRTPRLVHAYESVLKWMVWFIIVCFLFVVVKTGIPEPGKLLAGFVPKFPADVSLPDGTTITSMVVIVSGLSAAVGVNMLFVYPYSLRRRGWGRGERTLARQDLVVGMFLPYVIAASLMLIASASVFHFGEPDLFTGKKIAPAQMAEILAAEDRLGPTLGIWVFGLGVIAMALSSITMQMICSGFAFGAIFRWEDDDPRRTWATLVPAIGVLGAVFWSDIALWVAVPTNVLCGMLMPLAYIGFIRLQRSRRYLGADRPEGALGTLWVLGMGLATVVLLLGLGRVLWLEAPGYLELLGVG